MAGYADYLANKQKKTERLIEASKESEGSFNNVDTRFWKPTLDKEKGKGGAIIRFLPVPEGSQTLDYVDYQQYSFKWEATDKWLITKSLFKLNKEDPVYQLRQRLYATKKDVDKKLGGLMRANKVYIANILVIKDPAMPENEGKIFLYKYNATIQKIIDVNLKPEPDALTGAIPEVLDAFDMIDGANLEIRIKKTDNGWSYEGTQFSQKSSIINNSEEYDEIMGNVYELAEFIAPDTFQTYDQINERLALVIGEDYIGSGVKVLTHPLKAKEDEFSSPPSNSGGTQHTTKIDTAKSKPTLSDDEPPFDADEDDGESEQWKKLMEDMK
jgi:hypothetical protein